MTDFSASSNASDASPVHAEPVSPEPADPKDRSSQEGKTVVEEVPIDTTGVSCPSGNPDDPYGPTPDAPFGYRKDGVPKTSKGGRPPRRSPRDERPEPDGAGAERITSVPRAAPRKPKERPPIALTVDYESVAQGFASLWFSVGTIAFGADWQPDIEQREHIAVKDAIKRYVEIKQVADMPPGLNLAIVLTTYSLARLQRPTVRTRMQGIAESLKRGYLWLRAKLPIGR